MPDTQTQTAALAALYSALAATKAAGPRTVKDLSPEARRAYDRENKRQQRERAKAAKEAGRPEASDEAIRAALSDAALILLAAGGPGADAIERVVRLAFPGRHAVAGTTRMRARAGTLRPRVLSPEMLAAKS